MVARVAEDETYQMRILAAAADGLDILVKGWRRRYGSGNCERCSYAPDVVRYHLAHWPELESAVAGVPSAGANIIGSGSRDRMKLAAIMADLEAATDRALEPVLRWNAAARIYRRQSRFKRYLTLRQTALFNLHRPEPSAPLAEAICIEHIARELGWYPHEVCREDS